MIMKVINSAVGGVFEQDALWSEWWVNNDVSIPFFNDEKVVLIYINENWQEEYMLNEKVDYALSLLFSLSNLDRKAASKSIYDYCVRYCFREKNNFCNWLSNKTDIWYYIAPTTICMLQRNKDVDIIFNCECPFLKCNGLQLRFAGGETLPDISWQEKF